MRPEPIGVLGGTFDPVHVAHVELARCALERLPLARVVLLPCAIPPHKDAPDLSAAVHRKAMLDLAVAGHPGIEVSTLELERGGVSFTLDTLRAMRHGPPAACPVFVMGMDSLLELPTWHGFENLVGEFHLIAFDRPDRALEQVRDRLHPALLGRLREVGNAPPDPGALGPPGEDRPATVFHVPHEVLHVSSREIRTRVGRGLPIDDLVPPGVAGYIQDNGIYRREDQP